jgi:hypothetical protein
MRELRQRLRLAQQPIAKAGGGLAFPGAAQELEGDGPLQLRVVGLVDDAHAALAQLGEQDVAPHAASGREGHEVAA